MAKQSTRRRFLKTVAMGGVASCVPTPFLLAEEASGANQRINVAAAGAGGRGMALIRTFQVCGEAQVVAVADCFKSRRENAAKVCNAREMLDFQEFLADDTIDAVIVATPDHWHVPVALAAAKAKKHVYVEKPLGLTLGEILQCEKEVTQAGVVFQYGTQQRSQDNCWLGCECVRQGNIGKVTAIEVDAPNGGAGGNPDETPIPDDMSEAGYRQWLGTAPVRPYSADRCKPPGTYWIYDYSIGYLGGWGAHPLDIMVWGSDADLAGPLTVTGTGKIGETLYDTVYDWDMKICFAEVSLQFRPGSDRTRFIGETGDWIEVRRNGTSASRPELLVPPQEESILPRRAGRNHVTDFIHAIKTGGKPLSTLRDAVRSDTISHLCDIAVRTGSEVRWNPETRELVSPSDEQSEMRNRKCMG